MTRDDGRIGILGGTFNPVHHGHLLLAEHARETLGLARFYLMPSGRPPHKRETDLAPALDRLAMVEAAVRDDPALEPLDLEVRRDGTTFTIETLRALQQQGFRRIHFLIGADSVPDLPGWRGAPDFLDLADFVTVRRGSEENDVFESVRGRLDPEVVERLRRSALDSPRIDISASEIRRRVAAGRSIRYQVPESVREYIEARGLYREQIS